MEKIDALNDEIALITGDELRTSLEKFMQLVPDYFWEVPASASGKYHPPYAQGEGGLLRHTKATVKIAQSLFQNETLYKFSSHEKDLIIFALLIHDSFKLGEDGGKHTNFIHPKIVAEKIINYQEYLNLNKQDAKIIATLVASHMGQWVFDYQGKKQLPKPRSRMARFVHLCDYLASQSFLEVNFDM